MFKEGDKVVCIDNSGWTVNLVEGKVYTISEVFGRYVCIIKELGLWFSYSRFKLYNGGEKKMLNLFKEGDRVVCVDNEGFEHCLVKGDTYTVGSVDGRMCVIEGIEYSFSSLRFELAKEDYVLKGAKVKFVGKKGGDSVPNFRCISLPKELIIHGSETLHKDYDYEFAEVIDFYNDHFVIRYKSDDCRYVQLGFTRDKFELVEKQNTGFKVGDKVYATDLDRGIGEVMNIKHTDTILVYFPDWSCGHDGTHTPLSPKAKYATHCWWFGSTDKGLKLVEEQDTIQQITDTNKVEEVIKMNKPETVLEKNACKKAKEEAIRVATDTKARAYQSEINTWMSLEKSARDYRKRADELKDILELSEKDIKELL